MRTPSARGASARQAKAHPHSPHPLTLVIPRCPPASLNRILRSHWGYRHELVEIWRQEVAAAAIAAGRPSFPAARIHIRLFYSTARLPDPDNALCITSKLVLDGLVRAGVLPDDGPQHVRAIALDYIGVDRQNPRTEVLIQPET